MPKAPLYGQSAAIERAGVSAGAKSDGCTPGYRAVLTMRLGISASTAAATCGMYGSISPAPGI